MEAEDLDAEIARVSDMSRDALNTERRRLLKRIESSRSVLRHATGPEDRTGPSAALRLDEERLQIVEARQTEMYWEKHKSSYTIERERRASGEYTGPFVSGWSTPKMMGRLSELIRDLGLRPVTKSTSLTDLAEWAVAELPELAKTDERAAEALEIARAWWSRERSSK